MRRDPFTIVKWAQRPRRQIRWTANATIAVLAPPSPPDFASATAPTNPPKVRMHAVHMGLRPRVGAAPDNPWRAFAPRKRLSGASASRIRRQGGPPHAQGRGLSRLVQRHRREGGPYRQAL